jgi:hypothetical protein
LIRWKDANSRRVREQTRLGSHRTPDGSNVPNP